MYMCTHTQTLTGAATLAYLASSSSLSPEDNGKFFEHCESKSNPIWLVPQGPRKLYDMTMDLIKKF